MSTSGRIRKLTETKGRNGECFHPQSNWSYNMKETKHNSSKNFTNDKKLSIFL